MRGYRAVHATRRGVSLSVRMTVAIALGLSLVPGLRAQAPFDRSRAWLVDTTMFVPFVVSTTIPLARALAAHTVEDDTPVLVFETAAGPMALVTSQMAYHHVAQGQRAGEPWLVSF